MVRKFDTKVQAVKYRVQKAVAREYYNGSLYDNILDIPNNLYPGKEPQMRCCVYKERAITAERIKVTLGRFNNPKQVIRVLDIACDECPAGGYEVTKLCRGCLAHRCLDNCKMNAIVINEETFVAKIDKTKCVNCGKCAAVCPYSAIVNRQRPCEKVCKVNAIGINDDGSALIKEDKCINCGSCAYVCPFGAMVDNSYLLDVIDILKDSANNTNYPTYALIAPAIASQFVYAKFGQVITAIKNLGFKEVVEVALGADLAAEIEAKELVEKGFLFSSCCPAFVSYIKKSFPDLVQYISDAPSPMACLSKIIKEKHPNSKIVFIGPCTAKKAEMELDGVKGLVDAVITFEELQALYDSRFEEGIETLEETKLEDASYFGRIFARSGGLVEAIGHAIEKAGYNFDYRPLVCNGIEECRGALIKKAHNVGTCNFIEGMACYGGCINGAGVLTHADKSVNTINNHAKEVINNDYQKHIEEI